MQLRQFFRRPSLSLWLELLIFFAWLGLIIHSQIRIAAPKETSTAGLELLTAAGEGPGAEWMSVYLEGQKIGCGLSDTVKLSNGYRLQERTFLRLRAFDQDKEITTVMVAHTDLEYRLEDFDFMLSAPPSNIQVHGDVRGKYLALDIDTAGEKRQQKIQLEEVPEISLTFKARLLAQNPKVGDTIEIPYFDPATLSRQKMTVKVKSEGTALVDGKRVDTLTLESSYHGFSSSALVTREGRTLEETNALGMTVRRESRDEAIYEGWKGEGAPVDIIALSAVPVNTPISNPRELTYLDAILSGGGVEVLLGRPPEGGQVGEVTIQVVDRSLWKTYQIPMVDPRFADTLEATPLIQKDNIKIQKVAQSVIGDVTSAEDAAAMLNAWVHDVLRKEPVVGVPSALDVLANGKGDCNEHTTLYTALARAVGIPTRMAAGVVYSREISGSPAFYYHAWPEVYLGEWVAIDPTFGQFPADATHIKLVEGDLEDQLALIRVVGNLQIRIREYH